MPRVASIDIEDQDAPSRSAVVSVRASFGRERQSCVLGSGANEGGRRCGISPGAAGAEDSYRSAALSHEFRNLRKSSRVSLSTASCARAAHSAAFCLQYPIFSCMMLSPLEPAELSISPRGAELGEASIISTPEKRLKFQHVRWAKRSVPTRQSSRRQKPRGHGAKCAFADPTFAAAKFSTTRSWLGNRKRRRAFYAVEEANIECAV